MPCALWVVTEMVLAGANTTVPALLSRTPMSVAVALLASPLLTVRSETLKVPVVASSSRPGWVPRVPASWMKTLSMVPPPVSPVVPAMPPPVPWGSMTNPRTVVLSSRSTTSALLSVSVGRLAGDAGPQGVGADHQVGGLAGQHLVGLEVDAGGVPGGGVVAVEDEDRVPGRARRSRPGRGCRTARWRCRRCRRRCC